jgi:hypothetical protein
VGDAAKCERCGRGTDIARRDDYCSEATIRPLGVTSWLGERECDAIARVRAPLDAEIARLTAEVAELRGKLDEARNIIVDTGCLCECDHINDDGPDPEHVADCELCVPCRVRDALFPRHTTREGAGEEGR